jgi:hypothetical protein
MGAIPTMNRSAKEGARSSRHYGDEGVYHPPSDRKAKHETTFRFYNLYGHLRRRAVLEAARQRVRRNTGAAGSDGVTCEAIEARAGGVAAWLNDPRRRCGRGRIGRNLCAPSPF